MTKRPLSGVVMVNLEISPSMGRGKGFPFTPVSTGKNRQVILDI
jgi:hypothetical protein